MATGGHPLRKLPALLSLLSSSGKKKYIFLHTRTLLLSSLISLDIRRLVNNYRYITELKTQVACGQHKKVMKLGV